MGGFSAPAESRVQVKLENMAIANALQLEAARRRAGRSVLAVFGPFLYCYFAASDQNYDIAIGFNHPDFLKESYNLAIRRRFHAVTLTSYT